MKCECGCGREAKKGNRFLYHHHLNVMRWNFKGITEVRRYLHPAGYIQVRKPGEQKNIFEHRDVVEQAIARKLTSSEHVHHINGKKDDNRLENLEIVRHGEHTKMHMIGRFSGERHWNAHLTENKVSLIRKLCSEGFQQKAVAKRFGLTKQTVNDIVLRKTWRRI